MKIKKLGNTILFTTNITVEEYDLVHSMKPETFTVRDDKGNAIFKFSMAPDVVVSTKGLTLNSFSNDDKNFLQGNVTYYGSNNAKDIAYNHASLIRNMAIIEERVAQEANDLKHTLDNMAQYNIEKKKKKIGGLKNDNFSSRKHIWKKN